MTEKEACAKMVDNFLRSTVHPAFESRGQFISYGFNAGYRHALLESPAVLGLVEAVRKSIAVADDYADSGISRAIRDGLAAFERAREELK